VVAECDVSANVLTGGVGLPTTSWRAQGTAAEDQNGRTNPSYGAARWSTAPIRATLDTRFGAGGWRVDRIDVALKQSTLGAWVAGPVQLYYTNNDSILINPGNSSTRFGNFSTDYPDRAQALAWNFTPASEGAADPHQLYLAGGPNDPGAVSIESELHSNGTLTLLLYPGSPYMVATYAGYTNASLAGPTLVVFASAVPGCDSADFDCDGDVGTDADIEAFFACLAGNCPAAPCTSSADFNHDGDVGTDADIESFFRVLAGGPC
jgi:hypothetical protein